MVANTFISLLHNWAAAPLIFFFFCNIGQPDHITTSLSGTEARQRSAVLDPCCSMCLLNEVKWSKHMSVLDLDILWTRLMPYISQAKGLSFLRLRRHLSLEWCRNQEAITDDRGHCINFIMTMDEHHVLAWHHWGERTSPASVSERQSSIAPGNVVETIALFQWHPASTCPNLLR